MNEQGTLSVGSVNTNSISGTVYTVTVRWMDSPHPECVGVFQDESDADDLMRKCADRFSDPRPVVAWEKNALELE